MLTHRWEMVSPAIALEDWHASYAYNLWRRSTQEVSPTPVLLSAGDQGGRQTNPGWGAWVNLVQYRLLTVRHDGGYDQAGWDVLYWSS